MTNNTYSPEVCAPAAISTDVCACGVEALADGEFLVLLRNDGDKNNLRLGDPTAAGITGDLIHLPACAASEDLANDGERNLLSTGGSSSSWLPESDILYALVISCHITYMNKKVKKKSASRNLPHNS